MNISRGPDAEISFSFGPLDQLLTVTGRVGTADRWIDLILDEDTEWCDITAELCSWEQVSQMADMVRRQVVPPDELLKLSRSVLETLANRHWWETANILLVAREAWDSIGGELALRGITTSNVSLDAWLDAAWTIMRRLASQQGEQQLNELVHEIQRKPALDEDDAVTDENDFNAMMNELSGRFDG